MPNKGLPAAWSVAALLMLALAVVSTIVGPPRTPSLDAIIRASLATPHERPSLS
jgi:hypothetical protein